MCSRYSIAAPRGSALEQLLLQCAFTAQPGDIRPSRQAPVLIDEAQGVAARQMVWGFPSPEGGLVINARCETAAEKPLFRNAMMARRCVLPASFFYEWDRGKCRYRFCDPLDQPLYLAGLYQPFDGVLRFVILTTGAAGEMVGIHDRMPLCLRPQDVKPWLHSVSAALPLLRAAPLALRREADGGGPYNHSAEGSIV